MRPRVLVTVALVLGALWLGTIWLYNRQLVAERVTASNALAALDTSRLAVKRDGDSALAVASRLAFQDRVTLRRALQDSLNERGVALARARLVVDSLRVRNAGTGRVDTVTRLVSASGSLDTMDLKIGADVSVDPPSSSWAWRVDRRPLGLELALSCSGPRAVAHLAGPPWSRPVLDSVVQIPGVCNPAPVGWRPFELRLPGVIPAGLVFLAGVVLGARLK